MSVLGVGEKKASSYSYPRGSFLRVLKKSAGLSNSDINSNNCLSRKR